MKKKELKNKPLVEALVEVQWEITEESKKNFGFFVAEFINKIKNEYIIHESLPTVDLPSELSNHIVKYRFRKKEDSWPVIQLGNGIGVYNVTEEYKWDQFKIEFQEMLKNIDSSRITEVNLSQMELKYINAFLYEESNVVSFLNKNMNMNFSLREK